MDIKIISSLLILSSIFLFSLVIYGFRKRSISGAIEFSLVAIAMSIHSLGYAFELLSETIDSIYFWIKIEYIGISFFPFLIFLFISRYSDEKKFANKSILLILFLMNILTFILVCTNFEHHLFYLTMKVDTSLGYNIMSFDKGVWYYIDSIILISTLIYGIVVLANKLRKSTGDYKNRIVVCLTILLVTIVIFSIYTTYDKTCYLDFTTFMYLPIAIFSILALFHKNPIFFIPITQEMVVNSIDEAVIVVDSQDIIISYNKVSKQFLPSINKLAIGDYFSSIKEFANIKLDQPQMNLTINNRKLLVKLRKVEKNLGAVYVISDITESEEIKNKLKKIATTDFLTELNNRRFFMDTLSKNNSDGVLVILDIDHFKNINDTYGHFVGDEVLIKFSKLLKELFKDHLVSRYGGEEFAIFIENIIIEEVYELINNFRILIENLEDEIKYTFSAGLSPCRINTLSKSIIAADYKLYEAKNNGRNQVRY